MLLELKLYVFIVMSLFEVNSVPTHYNFSDDQNIKSQITCIECLFKTENHISVLAEKYILTAVIYLVSIPT